MAIGGRVTTELSEPIAAGPQADLIIASSYDDDALAQLRRRKATRLLSAPAPEPLGRQFRSLGASFLVQDADRFVAPIRLAGDHQEAADRGAVARPGSGLAGMRPDDVERHRHRERRPSRGRGRRSAVTGRRRRARRGQGGVRAQGGAAASDAFFPFPDGLLVLANAGVAAVIQPGGSIRDGEVTAAADEAGIAMVTTGRAPLPALKGGRKMTAKVLDGEALAAKIRAEVTDRVARLRSAGVHVGLGTILVGDDGPSSRYVAMKHADCAEVGINSVHEHLPATTTQAELESVVARFNPDPAVNAYLVQLPLPEGLDEERVLLAVDPEKDVDGLHPVNLGRLVMGAPGPLPCTPAGIVDLLYANEVPVEGRHVVDHRPGPDHRPPPRPAPGHEASGLQRRRHRRPHRRRTWRRWYARATSWWPRRAGPAWSRRT